MLLRIHKQKCFNLDLKCLAEVTKTSTEIKFQANIMVLTKKRMLEEVKHLIDNE